MKEFDYSKSVAQIEAIVAQVENPETGVFEAEELIKKANGMLKECYDYLRSERQKDNTEEL